MSLRDYQDDKADVIHKFNPDEARALKLAGELPENIKINENDDGEADNEDDAVRFAEDVEDEDEDAEFGAPSRNNMNAASSRSGMMPDSDSDLDIDDI